MENLGWDSVDVILITGDAYIDHPSFGAAVIGRILEKYGYRVAIIPQPNWKDDLRDFKKLGAPKLFFGVTSGAMDSMVNHYTANKRLRSDDAYTPGGKSGFRPDRAATEYSRILKTLYPDIPVILGGIEASMRRFAHYDYWDDAVHASILIESKADLLVYGMGEKTIIEIADKLRNGENILSITALRQTVYKTNKPCDSEFLNIYLNSHQDALKDKKKYALNFKTIEEESVKYVSDKRIIQKNGDSYIIMNPSNPPLTVEESDEIYNLPFSRMPHPRYYKRGDIPAYEMIKNSVNIHRGCFGGCSFCTISMHQGKFVQMRSEKSILRELNEIASMPDFKGHISDLGGPSANMYSMKGINEAICFKCKRISCIFPEICKNLDTDHSILLDLYEKALKIKGIKKVTIGSGIRYDLIASDKKAQKKYIESLLKNHVSGRLKVAPEHTEDKVLQTMRKPGFKSFLWFERVFRETAGKLGLKLQLIPYFISSHPDCTLEEMAKLAAKNKSLHIRPEQVQDFTPTPMTLSTVMYYSGYDPFTMQKVYTARKKEDKLLQKLFFFSYLPENKRTIAEALKKHNLSQWIQVLGLSSRGYRR